MKRPSPRLEILLFALLIIVGLFLLFRPTTVSRENSRVINTMVYHVKKGAEGHVILHLQNGHGTYFINQGLRKGLNLDSLKKQLVNQQVQVFYLKPGVMADFSPVASTHHITELRLGTKVIYTEL